MQEREAKMIRAAHKRLSWLRNRSATIAMRAIAANEPCTVKKLMRHTKMSQTHISAVCGKLERIGVIVAVMPEAHPSPWIERIKYVINRAEVAAINRATSKLAKIYDSAEVDDI